MNEDWLAGLATFARAYPANAAHLAEPGMDPDVERLAEAFDYLAAKVRRIVDRRSIELIDPLAEIFCPELQRALPAATILQLNATPPRSKRISVNAGAEFNSVPCDGTACVFRAMSALDVVPWAVAEARAEWSAEHGQSVVLDLEAVKPNIPLASLFPLRLHFASETPHAETLLLWFCRRLEAIELHVHGVAARVLRMGPKNVRPWGLDRTHALLPIEPLEHPGFRLLREYFVLPQKFAFADVHAPEGALEEHVDRVSLVFRFESTLPATTRVTRDAIRLNCVPVINVFDATTDPIRPTLEVPMHALRVAGVDVNHAAIYAVRAAHLRMAGERDLRPLASLMAFGATPPDALRGTFFATHLAPERRPEPDLCVSLGTAEDAGPLPELDFASFDVWATNGTLAPSLRVGDVCMPGPRSPRGVAFRNIRFITPYVPPPRGGRLRERTTAFLSMTARRGYDRERLQCLLRCLDPNGLTRTQAGRAEAQRLEAVESVVFRPGRVRSRGALVRGQDIEVVLGRGNFVHDGEVFVFASILDRLFAFEAPLSSYTRTKVRWLPTGLSLDFPPRHSDHLLDA